MGELAEKPGEQGDLVYSIRPGTADDYHYVVDSWRRNYEDCFITRCPGGLPEYLETQRTAIDWAMHDQLAVAHPEVEPRQILGWVAYRAPSVLHYVFVKQPYRSKDIGWALLEHALGESKVVYVTHHWSRPWKRGGEELQQLMKKAGERGVRIEFNPFLVLGR